MYRQQIEKLQRIYSELERKIDTLQRTGNSSDQHLADLRQQRLTLKDQIFRLQRNQWEHDYDRHGFDDE
jgi:hypothetical protein